MNKEDKTFKHPAFGQISFSRIIGRNRFYGSDLVQDNYIEMRVHQSELIRNLTDDRHHTTSHVLTVRLTGNQFSELITSMNIGDGVPCTIERISGVSVQELDHFETRKDVVHNEFKNRMKDMADRMTNYGGEIKDILKKQTISKKDREELNKMYDSFFTEMRSNIPFFLECFQENMDKVVKEAKMEIEAGILNRVTQLGLAELQNQNKLLENSNETDQH